jgi:hypothetical protein
MTTLQIIKPIELAGSHKTGSLPDSLTVKDIERVLGFAANFDGDYGKVQFSWSFEVDGKQCGIWDYKGIRWSIFDPQNVLPELFAEVIAKATGRAAV